MKSHHHLNCLIVGNLAWQIDNTEFSQSTLVTMYQGKNDVPNRAYTSTPSEQFSFNKNLHQKEVSITLDCSIGAELFTNQRRYLFHNKEVYILPFSYENPLDLENIRNYWIPEIQLLDTDSLIYLVGIHSVCNPEVVSMEEVKEVTEKWGVFHYDCESFHDHDINLIFDLIFKDAAGQLYAEPKMPHRSQETPFFEKYFMPQSAQQFAVNATYLVRGHLQSDCILSDLPSEIFHHILLESGQPSLKDPNNKENKFALDALARLVYDNSSRAQATTGQQMVWHRFFQPHGKEKIEIYPNKSEVNEEKSKNLEL